MNPTPYGSEVRLNLRFVSVSEDEKTRGLRFNATGPASHRKHCVFSRVRFRSRPPHDSPLSRIEPHFDKSPYPGRDLESWDMHLTGGESCAEGLAGGASSPCL